VTAPTPRFDFTATVPSLEMLGRVHLIAIGGAGMSAVARLMLARGLPVSGSDAADSPTLESLRDSGARVHLGHDPAHVADADAVVVSSTTTSSSLPPAALACVSCTGPRPSRR
jgi:UDP-N-acetylmuramate--alanine ligase